MVIDLETGEIVGDKFAKLFFDDLGKLFSMSNTELKLFMLMVRDSKLGGQNIINMSPKRKKQYAEELCIKNHRSITELLRRMVSKDILKDLRDPEEAPYKYQINPMIMFKGNDYQRAKLIISYSEGKRRVRVFASVDEVAMFLNKETEGVQDGEDSF